MSTAARHEGEHDAPQPVQALSPASNYSATSSTRPLSSSRVQPLAPGSSIQTPSATASPQSNGHGPASPMGGGPIGSSWSVPPRPKPGRKPATDEPLTKRKAQNREAQRAFRARKKQTLESMENSLKSKAEIHQEEIAKKDAVIADLNKQIEVQNDHITTLNRKFIEAAAWEKEVASKDREIAFWKGRFEDAERAARGEMTLSGRNSPPAKKLSLQVGTPQPFQDLDVGCGNCKADGRCACIEAFAKDHNLNSPTKISTSDFRGQSPADSLSPEQEIDFTSQFSRPKYNGMPKPDDRASITFLTDQDSTCGFCTDETNCACKIESLQQLSRSEMPPPSQTRTLQNSSSNCPTGPGSCADCMANPRQKAWCEAVSRLKTPGAIDDTWSRSSTKMAPIRSRSPYSLPKPPMSTLEPSNPTVGCDEAFRLFDGRLDMESDRMDWVKNLRPVSPTGEKDTAMDTGRKYSAVELESASVIASLTHTMGPLVPRSTDGPNAELVEIADKRRKLINSPSSMQTRRGQTAGSPGLPISTLVNGGARSVNRH
ncbi:hypothetical protein BU16DRAFT_538253 [Lophium mytilinum]|uniref:BZIP domain-containing protein n=1 Tax=Lophium mytilinum TaxID=390894 RepID=A0A6A6QYJ5_9PEZI|nr:hypothetical protein BU16DRAFT_538253 [Lophium mytilinum]